MMSAICAIMLGAMAGFDFARISTVAEPPRPLIWEAALNSNLAAGNRYSQGYRVDHMRPKSMRLGQEGIEMLKDAEADIVVFSLPHHPNSIAA